MTNLHRIIGYLAATLVELAMAGAFGAAPMVVLDIPTPTASRMSPCPVHAGINIASSSTGDSSSWDQCRIMWQLEADGSALDDWPSKYRYVTDPRPGLNSKQIDLAGQTDTGNYNRPRGFNFGWVLTTGTWRIKCTVTNPEGSSTTTTSSDIVIAADTRTEYTVQASGGDYTTLAAALTARAATSNVKITVEDGHTENLTAALTTVTGDNFVIRQAGTGTKPVLTFSNTGHSGGVSLLKFSATENAVAEGLVFADSTGNTLDDTSTIQAIDTVDCVNSAFAFCECTGTVGVNMVSTFVGPTGCEGELVLACESDVTRRYSVVSGSVAASYCKLVCVVGGGFGPSISESVCRTLSPSTFWNFSWVSATNNEVKSSIRWADMDYGSQYGCVMTDGDNWTGRAEGVNGDGVTNVRIEASYATGTISAAAAVCGITEDVRYVTAANNILQSDTHAGLSLGNSADYADPVKHFIRLVHNTANGSNGFNNEFIGGGNTGGQANHANNRAAANLFLHDDAVDMTEYFLDIGEGIADFVNNVFPATQTNLVAFSRVYVGAGAFDGRYHTDVSELNAETWASGNTETDVTLDAEYRPSSPTTVTTEAGVYDDYYGNPRGPASYVGAVDSPLFRTYFPGIYIDRQ